MDTGPHPLLLGCDVRDTGIDSPGRLEHRIAVLEEVLEGGGGRGDIKDTVGFCAANPLDPGVADARTVEGSVDPGCDVL